MDVFPGFQNINTQTTISCIPYAAFLLQNFTAFIFCPVSFTNIGSEIVRKLNISQTFGAAVCVDRYLKSL